MVNIELLVITLKEQVHSKVAVSIILRSKNMVGVYVLYIPVVADGITGEVLNLPPDLFQCYLKSGFL